MAIKNETINKVAEKLSRAIGLVEACDDELEWYFERHDGYNDAVRYQIRDAARLLGYGLACFFTWEEDFDSDGYPPAKESEAVEDKKPFKLYYFTPSSAASDRVFLGYYRTVDDAVWAACAVSGSDYQEVLDAWSGGKDYKSKGGSVLSIQEREEDE